MSNGIDVYVAYQAVTDWSAVKRAGYDFCYVKAGDGTSTRATNGYGPLGRSAGLAMGAYWYAQPGDPIRQANMLCDRAVSEGLADLAPALDIESPFVPGPVAAAFAAAFCGQVALRGFRPAVYANDAMMSAVRAAVLAVAPNAVVWVARYGRNPVNPYHVWQWNDAGSVPGISASGVDLNRGDIPYNLAAPPAGVAPKLNNDEESTMLVPAGTNAHVVIPCAGRPQYWYLYAAYGRTVKVHQVDYQMPSESPERFTPGGFNDGSLDASGFHGVNEHTWVFESDKPGPVRCGVMPDGRQPVGISIRYSSEEPFTAYCG